MKGLLASLSTCLGFPPGFFSLAPAILVSVLGDLSVPLVTLRITYVIVCSSLYARLCQARGSGAETMCAVDVVIFFVSVCVQYGLAGYQGARRQSLPTPWPAHFNAWAGTGLPSGLHWFANTTITITIRLRVKTYSN